MPITVFGSINQDLVAYTNKIPLAGETIKGNSFQSHLGGKGFNESIAISKLKSLNDKFTVKLWACLGDEKNDSTISNEKFLNYLNKNNINTNLIKSVNETQTGTAIILVENNNNGENRILYIPGANNYLIPSLDELNDFFNPSNHIDLQSSIENPIIPSNLNAHSTKPLNNEELVKTTDINPHPPSNLHSHASSTSLLKKSNKQPESIDGLTYKNGNLIHNWSASGTNLASNFNLPSSNSSSSFIHSHSTKPLNDNNDNNFNRSRASSMRANEYKPVLSSIITNSIHDNSSYPSDLHSHSSSTKIDTLTYPSPKPSAVDLQNNAIALASKAPVPNSSTSLKKLSNANLTGQQRLTNISFSLGGTSAHSSTVSLTPCESYLHMISPSNNIKANQITDQHDLNYMVVLQNEIPQPTKIIHHLAKNFPNVSIFFNASPLPINKKDYNDDLLNALHESTYIVINEHELLSLVENFHADPKRNPLTFLKNISNYVPNNEFKLIVENNLKLVTKLRTILTKPNLIVTLGAYGIIYSIAGQFSYGYVPSEDIDNDDIVDTTGAGDTFLGGLVTSLYRQETLESAIKFGSRAAAITIQTKGAAESMPTYKQVEKRGWIL